MVDRKESAWIALAAACALVLHLFLSGLVGAALAGQGDTAICSGVERSGFPRSDQPARQHTAADCCLAGCPMIAGKAGLPGSVLIVPPVVDGTPLPPPKRDRIDPLHEWIPANPRGPPPSA